MQFPIIKKRLPPIRNDVLTSWSVRYHCNRVSNLLLNELDVFSAVLRKLFILLDTTDITVPSWKLFKNWFCFFKIMCRWEVCCNLSINLISYTYRNLFQVSKHIKNCKCYICCSLHSASILGSNTVEPAHSSRTSGCSTELSAISTAASQFISLISKNLTYESSCSNSTGVCFTYSYNLLNLIWWDSSSDCTISG